MSEAYHEIPLPQEDVTSEEYARSLESLQRFTEVDINTIQTIEDLSTKASLVGQDLRTVVLAKGEIYEQKEQPQLKATEPPRVVSRAYRIKRYIGGHTLYVTANDDIAGIAFVEEADQQGDAFSISLPVHGDIRVSSNPSENMSSAVGVQLNEGKRTVYLPAMQPTNPQVQQGFAHLLQEGIKTVLPQLPPPTIVPFKL